MVGGNMTAVAENVTPVLNEASATKTHGGAYIYIYIYISLCSIDESRNSLQATNFSYIKRYTNQSGLMKYNSGVRLPLPT
jgi:hypothetical protein